MVGFILQCFGSLALGIYFLVIQYYVLRVEVILLVILVVLNGLELILGFFSCWQFQSYEKQQ